MASVIWLARHGNREDFVDPTWAERAEYPDDPPLSTDGHDQARRLGARLRGEGIVSIFCSPFLRTVQTAAEVAEILDLPIQLEPGFGEYLNPGWFAHPPELRTISDLQGMVPRVRFDPRPFDVPIYPETCRAAYRRAARTVQRVAGLVDAPVLFVGHGASVSGAAMLLACEDRETACPLAALFKLRGTGGGWKVEVRADTTHLEASMGGDRYR
jgi:broad specificity phosphatase PhoE